MNPGKTDRNSFWQVYDIVREIPPGFVATYGQIATLMGNPRLARAVGYALHRNPDPANIPCHRVVNRLGEPAAAFAFGGANIQLALLEAEGVPSENGRIDLARYLWLPEAFR